MTRRRRPWGPTAAVVFCAALVVHALLPDGASRDVLFVVIGVAAVIAIAREQRRMTGPSRRAWLLLTLGVAAWVVGDIAWTVLSLGLGREPYPSVADIAYVVSYPLLAVGLIKAFPAPTGGRPVWWLDAFLIVGGPLLALWILVLDPAIRLWLHADGALVGALYPVGDALLLITLTRSSAAILRGRRSAYRLTGLAIAVILVADVLFQVGQTQPVLADHLSLLDSLWLTGYAFLLFAARRHRDRGTEPPGPSADLNGTHFVLIALSSSVVPISLLVAGATRARVPLIEVCSIGILMVAAMMTRFWGVLVDLRGKNVQLAHAAVTDPLTGLANTAGLASHVERADAQEGTRPALLLVGLDGYRDVVETLGHQTANEMLRAVGRALADIAPPGATTARLSRDLFALSVDVGHDSGADLLAETILSRLGNTVDVGGMDLTTGVVVGIAEASRRPATLPDLVSRADVALWSARRSPERIAHSVGGGPGEPGPAPAGTALLRDLVGGVERGELVVHFQPVATVATGQIRAAEALVRWQHPVHGLLGPAEFVPAAERTGLIRPVTLAVLDTALRWCTTWRQTLPDFAVAVNVSAHDVDDPRLIDDVRAALHRHGLPASALSLEVTETMAMRDVPRGEQTLQALAALGIELAVDDYGVGYGSLDYLRRLPFTVLKVDRAFVAPARTDPACASILRSTVALGHALGMHVIAEGVEDAATFELLAELGCDSAQGWALGRPAAPEDLTRTVRRSAAEPRSQSLST